MQIREDFFFNFSFFGLGGEIFKIIYLTYFTPKKYFFVLLWGIYMKNFQPHCI
jgi:hypothetical protein